MLKKFLFVIITLIVFIAGLLGYASYRIWYQNNFKTLLQTVVLRDRNVKYLLFTDLAGFVDRSWYIYEIPSESGISKEMHKAHNKKNVLFWNYSEAGNNTEDPILEVVNEKYLVFSRGNFYHSLYDIEKKQVLFNHESPWAEFIQSDQYKLFGEKADHEQLMELMDKWVNKNIHFKIQNLL